ncbi:hypothetical protein PAECIP111893_00030 [Paenibacillus plantiphilus]|uniref:HTH LytTR-type domain-containing protein n=1 Tax=Paenibacillus plantiphilus TaxID=2905650 RepID=A0ABM9BMI1_9BACL|nr:hypothetical protein [Paenibacillus plantiphilus]CAH1189932.1 hypothetical protein PAECIP111893_00030 [Paenibacillus plantiphilus]
MYMLDAAGERAEVNIEEVCMIVPRKEGPLFITADGAAYRFPQTTRELVGLFGDLGFELIDRNAIINMNKAVRFDAVDRKVYFNEHDGGDEHFYATVSAANQRKVNHLIRESSAAAMEYTMSCVMYQGWGGIMNVCVQLLIKGKGLYAICR